MGRVLLLFASEAARERCSLSEKRDTSCPVDSYKQEVDYSDPQESVPDCLLESSKALPSKDGYRWVELC